MKFDRETSVANYTQGPPRLVPGFADMQRMALILLAERASADAHILVVGAGGGLELKAFAEARPGWRFVGVDPSADMLALAVRTLGPLAGRVDLIEGVTDDAPAGPFDGATCLLTMHFLDREKRLATARAIRTRLKPGAPLVVAHHSYPDAEAELWLTRYAAFASESGVDAEHARAAPAAIREKLPVLAPEQDEQLMRDAGFRNVRLFYAGFTFRGWVADA